MSKTKFLTIAVAALVLLDLGLVAFFLSNKKPAKPEGPRKIIIERLRFDAQQIADYEILIKKHRADIEQKRDEIAAAKKALYAQLKGSDFSKKDSLADCVGQLQAEVEHIHFDHFRDIKNLCRAEQIAFFDALADDLAAYFPGPKAKSQ